MFVLFANANFMTKKQPRSRRRRWKRVSRRLETKTQVWRTTVVGLVKSQISSSWTSHLRTTGCHQSMVLTIFTCSPT